MEITAYQIQQYLINNGWEQDVEFKNKNLMVFDSKKYRFRIAVSADEKYEDFGLSVSVVLETIAHFSHKTTEEILKEISIY